MKQTRTVYKHKQGFTLVELLVVMAIIAILMGLVAGLSGVIGRNTGEAKTRAQLSNLMTEIENYRADNGRYPPSESVSGRDVMVLYQTSALPTDPKGFMDWYEDKYSGTRFDIMEIGEDEGKKFLLDHWGKAVIYKYDNDNQFLYLLGSTGLDTEKGGAGSSTFGDGDDITNRNGAL